MAKRKVKSTGISFALNDSGMGEYERAGLAGLYMSLTAAEAWAKDSFPSSVKTQAKELKNLISWRLREDKISLCLEWEDEDKALAALVKWAWQVKDGVFFLPAIHRKREYLDNYYLRVHIHSGLLNTFFQFGSTIKKEKEAVKKIEAFDETQTFSVSYRAISSDAKPPQHQKTTFTKGIHSHSFAAAVNSWIYPGSEPRFNNNPLRIKQETSWRGLPRFAYLMLFAPLACYYIHLPRTKTKKRMTENWAFIIPQVRDLKDFQRLFLRCLSNHSNWPFNDAVASMEDAILRYAVSTNLRRFIPHGEAANVLIVVMGNAGYYGDQQKTRKNFLRVQINPSAYTRNALFNRIYPVGNTIRKRGEENEEQANRYIRLPSSRERITANILAGVRWYSELASVPFWQRDQIDDECKKARDRGLRFLGINLPGRKKEEKGDSVSPERLWFLKLHQFERNQLMELSNEERMWDSPEEKRLLETLRYSVLWRLLNEEECAAVRRGGSRLLPKRWDDTVEKWHRRFLRAKTRPLFRAVIHELLSTAQRRTCKWDEEKQQISRIGGTIFPTAKDKDDAAFRAWFWHEVNDPHGWQRVRDLALLALVTFTDGRLATNRN